MPFGVHPLSDGKQCIFGNATTRPDGNPLGDVVSGSVLKPELRIPAHLIMTGVTLAQYHPFRPDPRSALALLGQIKVDANGLVTRMSSHVAHLNAYLLYAESNPSDAFRRKEAFKSLSGAQANALKTVFKTTHGGYNSWLARPSHVVHKINPKKKQNKSHSWTLCAHPDHKVLSKLHGGADGNDAGRIDPMGMIRKGTSMCSSCYSVEEKLKTPFMGVHTADEVMSHVAKPYAKRFQKRLTYNMMILVASCDPALPGMAPIVQERMWEHGSCMLMFFLCFKHIWSNHMAAMSIFEHDNAQAFMRYMMTSNIKKMVSSRATMINNVLGIVTDVRVTLYERGYAAVEREPSTLKDLNRKEVMPFLKLESRAFDATEKVVKLAWSHLFVFWNKTCYTRAFVAVLTALKDISFGVEVNVLLRPFLSDEDNMASPEQFTPMRLPNGKLPFVDCRQAEEVTWEYLYYLIFTLRAPRINLVGSYTRALLGCKRRVGIDEHVSSGAVFAMLAERDFDNVVLQKMNIHNTIKSYIDQPNREQIVQLMRHEHTMLDEGATMGTRAELISHAEQLGMVDVDFEREWNADEIDEETVYALSKVKISSYNAKAEHNLNVNMVQKKVLATKV